MIFGNNTTMLGNINIPMAEGYDCSYGASLALVESARNDYSMFRAMLEADYREISICRESSGYVMESEISALHEAVGGGILKKVVDLFKKLIAKIKSIFSSFFAKIRGLYMKDKDLVNTYKKKVITGNYSRMEVKWRKIKHDDWDSVILNNLETSIETFKTRSKDGMVDTYKEAGIDASERFAYWANKNLPSGIQKVENASELREEAINYYFDAEEIVEMGDRGMPSMSQIIVYLTDYKKSHDTLEKNAKRVTNTIESTVNSLEKNLMDIARDKDKSEEDKTYSTDPKEGEEKKEATGKHLDMERRIYEMAQSLQDVVVAICNVAIECDTIKHKYYRAAFVKAAATDPKKLNESSIYATALAEAEAEEVDSIITSAISKEDISDVSAASKNIGSYSDDELSYDIDDGYSSHNSYAPASSKCESSYFGKLFY